MYIFSPVPDMYKLQFCTFIVSVLLLTFSAFHTIMIMSTYLISLKSDDMCLRYEVTRSSADADNGLDAFSSQSRSTNMVPFWVHCDFSLSM